MHCFFSISIIMPDWGINKLSISFGLLKFLHFPQKDCIMKRHFFPMLILFFNLAFFQSIIYLSPSKPINRCFIYWEIKFIITSNNKVIICFNQFIYTFTKAIDAHNSFFFSIFRPIRIFVNLR